VFKRLRQKKNENADFEDEYGDNLFGPKAIKALKERQDGDVKPLAAPVD